ncbi:MAG: NmrA family NAD(P)-binding protein [Trueperaceae bacterium]
MARRPASSSTAAGEYARWRGTQALLPPRQLRNAGAQVVQGDLDDPATLASVLAGTYGVFSVQNFSETIMTPPGGYPEGAACLTRNHLGSDALNRAILLPYGASCGGVFTARPRE